jgi:hypothetical protein
VATLRRSMRQVHRAGEKLFVDYAGQSIGYGREGDRAQIFVATLGASNYTIACATAHRRARESQSGASQLMEIRISSPYGAYCSHRSCKCCFVPAANFPWKSSTPHP